MTKTLREPRQWVSIPALCFMRRPGDTLRCTLGPQHNGDHWHTYSRTAWPRRSGETQAD